VFQSRKFLLGLPYFRSPLAGEQAQASVSELKPWGVKKSFTPHRSASPRVLPRKGGAKIFCRCANFALTFYALVFSFAVFAQNAAQPKLRTTPLIIETATGAQRFTVEMALSETERERGLMFREKLGDNEGMLFFFPRDQAVSMWMKNTRLPLDMIFIGADGAVALIAENAVPQSLAIISSNSPVRAVLEVRAGTARRLQVKPGSLVRNVVFGSPVEDKKP
jgi:uncharacterized membrane protein (UPF0127 family)